MSKVDSGQRLRVDTSKFRPRMAADSTFLVPALDDNCHENGAKECRSIVKAIFESPEITLIIPFPVLAERLISGREEYSNLAQVEFVTFEYKAAQLIKKIGEEAAGTVQVRPTQLRQFIKYDAMIVASAKAWNADLIISNDKKVRDMSNVVGLNCYKWQHFMSTSVAYRQSSIFEVEEEVE